jgi:hypothetical protein
LDGLPWDLLALLNVKYVLVTSADWYTNHRDGERAIGNVAIVANPRPVTLRVFFARTVTPVPDRQEALRALAQTEALGMPRNVVTDSVVEN